MSILNAIVLGTLQGLTEFLPVSSSGHLAVLQHFLKLNVPLSFDVFLHTATMLATIIYFRRDISRIFKGVCSKRADKCEKTSSNKFVLFLVLSTLFTMAIAFPLKDKVETAFSNLYYVKWAFLITAVFLFLTKFVKRKDYKDINTMTKKDALLIGIVQGLAVFPGISRSGATIAGGLFAGLKKDFVGVYSFLLSIVIIAAATAYEGLQLFKDTTPAGLHAAPMAAGFIAAFVFGYAALGVLIPIIKKGNLHFFSYYLFALFIALLYFAR